VGGVDNWKLNLGAVDLSRKMVYEHLDGGDPDPNYYGVVALDGISGCRVTGKGSSIYIRDSSFVWISTIDETGVTEPGVCRIWIGSGPFTVEPNEDTRVCFALVAGSDLEELQANAELAAQKYLELDDNTSTGPVIPSGFSLGQNIPNPFIEETLIRYSIPHPCDVLIDVYSATGIRVRSIQRKSQAAGSYSLLIEGEHLDPGIYFYSLRAGEFSKTCMMVRY